MTRLTHTVSTETALEIVAKPERRSMLTRLIDSEDDVVSLAELVEHVTPENPPPEPARTNSSDRILLELTHVHLPKLEAAGLAEYDERTETVRYRPNERVEKLHEFVTTTMAECRSEP